MEDPSKGRSLDPDGIRGQKASSPLDENIQMLIQENNLLKDQIEELLNSINDVEHLKQTNAQLNSKVLNLKKKNNDIEHRLQISIQKNLKFKEDIIENDKNQSLAHNNDMEALQKSYKSIIDQLNDQINEITLELNQTKQKNSELDDCLKENRIQNEQICDLSTIFFSRQIKSIEDLVSILNEKAELSHQIVIQPQQPINLNEESSNSLFDFQVEIKRVKKQIKKDFYQKSAKKIATILQSYEKSLNEINDQISQKNIIISDKTNRIEHLEKENKELVSSVTSLKTQIEINNNIHQKEHNETILKMDASLKEANSMKMDLMKENSSIKSQMKNCLLDVKKIKEQYSHLQNIKESLESENIVLIGKCDLLEVELSRIKEENVSMKSQAADITTQFNEKIKLVKQLQSSVIEIKKNNNQLEQELFFEQNENQKLKTELNELINKHNETLEKQDELEKELNIISQEKFALKEINLKLKTENQKLISQLNRKEPPYEEQLLPLGAWSCEGLPIELVKLIGDIAQNPTIKTPTKLKNALLTIRDWYETKIHRLSENLDEFKKQNIQKVQMLNEISSILSESLRDDINITKSESITQLRERLLSDEKEIVELRNRVKLIDEGMLQLLVELECDTLSDATDVVIELKKTIDFLHLKLKTKQKRKKRIELDHNEAIKEINSELMKARSEIISKTENINDLKKELEQNKNNLEDVKNYHSDEIRELNGISQGKINEYEKQMSMQLDQLNELKERNSLLETLIREEQKNSTGLTSQVEDLNLIIEQKNIEIDNMQKRISDQKLNFKQRIDFERKGAKSKEAAIISTLSKQNTEMKILIQSLEKEKSELEEDLENTTQKLSELELDNQKLNLQIKNSENEKNREISLVESKYRAISLKTSAECRDNIEILRKELGECRNELIQFVVNQLRQFLPIDIQSVDSNSFDSFIGNVKHMLEDYDKAMSYIPKGQSLSGAVYSLVQSR